MLLSATDGRPKGLINPLRQQESPTHQSDDVRATERWQDSSNISSNSHAYLAQHRDKLRQYIVEYGITNGGQ
jgi:hypothetical protein